MPDELKKALDDMAHWADGNPEFRAFLKGVVQGISYNPNLSTRPPNDGHSQGAAP